MANKSDLGKKIAEIRNIKGLSQEELAKKAGINVRSLQRIEAGHVQPRAYTLRVISEVLDFDLNDYGYNDNKHGSFLQQLWEALVVSNALVQSDERSYRRYLILGWVGGIIYLTTTIPEVVLEVMRWTGSLDGPSTFFYFLTSIVVMISVVFFMNGFVAIGYRFDNGIVVVASYLFMGATLISYGVGLIYWHPDELIFELLTVTQALLMGVIGLVFGIGLSRLEKHFGSVAKSAAILEIVAGICFILVIPFLLGLFLTIPAIILEIVLLYKAEAVVKAVDRDTAFA